MVKKIKLLDEMLHKVLDSFSKLIRERGIRAEFQSALGLFLVTIWLCSPWLLESVYSHALTSLFSKYILAFICLIIATGQTVGNIFYYPFLRLSFAFMSCILWSFLALVGLFSLPGALIVPVTLSLAFTEALVFIHLETMGCVK